MESTLVDQGNIEDLYFHSLGKIRCEFQTAGYLVLLKPHPATGDKLRSIVLEMRMTA